MGVRDLARIGNWNGDYQYESKPSIDKPKIETLWAKTFVINYVVMKFATLPLLALASICLSATPITFTETATASGSLGGSAFTGSLITLTASGDTSNVLSLGGGTYELTGLTLSLTVTSLGATANVTGGANIFSCQNCATSTVGISDVADGGSDILDTISSAFAAYALATAIGPVGPAAAGGNPGLSFGTSLGSFSYTSIANSTFTAAVGSAIPEPATLALCGLSLVGLVALKRRTV